MTKIINLDGSNPSMRPDAVREEADAVRKMLEYAADAARRIGGHDAASLMEEAARRLHEEVETDSV